MWHALHGWLDVFWSWPNGSLWSNILANPVIWVLGFLFGEKRMKKHLNRHHEEHMNKLDELHKRLDDLGTH